MIYQQILLLLLLFCLRRLLLLLTVDGDRLRDKSLRGVSGFCLFALFRSLADPSGE